MKALKQVLFVKDASKAADLWAAENGSKAAWRQQLRNTRRGCASRRTNVYVDLGPRWRGGDGT
jgi:hypothetical protein